MLRTQIQIHLEGQMLTNSDYIGSHTTLFELCFYYHFGLQDKGLLEPGEYFAFLSPISPPYRQTDLEVSMLREGYDELLNSKRTVCNEQDVD